MMRGVPGQTQLAVGSLTGWPARAEATTASYLALYSGFRGGVLGPSDFPSRCGVVMWMPLTFSQTPDQSGNFWRVAFAWAAPVRATATRVREHPSLTMEAFTFLSLYVRLRPHLDVRLHDRPRSPRLRVSAG